MKTKEPRKTRGTTGESRSGQMLILFAVVVLIMVVMCVLSVDVGRIVTSNAELRNAVDAAALAGASQLRAFVDEGQKALAREQATALACANEVAGDPLTIDPGTDIIFGRYIEGSRTFKPEAQFGAGEVVDSVMIQGRRTEDSPDGPIELFFASIFGIHATAQTVRAVGTKPRRYVMFVMDRSGSMCYDTTNILYRYSPNADASMDKSPTQWYWMPRRIYKDGYWQTAWMYALDDGTGDTVTDFLPPHIQSNLLYGTYFRYCSKDQPGTVQSGWLNAPANLTIYSSYGATYSSWTADSYGPISSCDYAMANDKVEPIQSSQDAAVAFVDLLNSERDRAGLVSYAWYGTLDHQLTDDWPGLQNQMQVYDARGATALGPGMETANDEFIDSGRASGFGQRIMILLTDGLANTVDGNYYNNPYSDESVTFFGTSVQCQIYQAVVSDIATETQRAMNNGIRIYAVSFGAGADQKLMPLIAAKTRGAYYYAADHSDLTDIFVDIFYNLPAVLTY